ncbi:zwei Ig domain protein zig-8-like [Amphibalanus amphitrite]|uniref:zwei Ig domain protein zig-8-like n=1 Tax=Amphibalanus amphitrite TaxID=1232801 RepID=UPI001C92401C|nr:zwei Ig domain protein zig-8-like [Amphibalanus amphitrite]
MKLPDMVPLPPRPTLLFVVSLNLLLHRASVAEPVVVGASDYLGGAGSSGQMPRLEYGGTANVTASVGQTARLLCRIYHLGERAVSWIRKRDLHILTTDIFTYTSDARFQVAHQEGSSNWTLLVNYAQTRDSGIYECQVNTEPKRSLAFNLHVVESFARIQGPGRVFAKFNSILRLTCVVNMPRNSNVELTWLLDGRPLGEERWVTESSDEYVTSRLVIRSARDSDSGTYTCAPTRAAHADVQVHVISGEHPAAMQHGVAGGQRPVCPHLILLLIGHVIVACSR